MKKILVALMLGMISIVCFSAPKSHKCPLCGTNMTWTGDTQTEWGKLVYKMKCVAGHISWEVDESNDRSKEESSSTSSTFNNDVKCQYDGYTMHFTGETKTEWGKLLKEYKYAAGHTVWVTQ